MNSERIFHADEGIRSPTLQLWIPNQSFGVALGLLLAPNYVPEASFWKLRREWKKEDVPGDPPRSICGIRQRQVGDGP